MSILKYGLVVAGVVGVIAGVPYITKSSIDNNLMQKQIELKQNGVSLDVVKNEGYFEINRDLYIKVNDEKKLLNYIFRNSNLDENLLNEITINGEIFKELSLKGIVTNDNIISQSFKVALTFDKLPTSLKNSNNIELKKLIENFKLNMDISKNGKVSSLFFNDISLKDSNKVVKVINPKMVLDKDRYKTTISNVTFNIDNLTQSLTSTFDKIEIKNKHKDNFNNESEIKIDNIDINYKEQVYYSSKNISYKSKKNSINSKVFEKNKNINWFFNLNTSNMNVEVDAIKVKLDNFSLDAKLNNLKGEAIKDLDLVYENKQRLDDILDLKMQEVLNYGFSIDLKSNLNYLKSTMGIIKTLNLDFDIRVSKNNLSTIDEVSKYLFINGELILDNDTIASIGMLGVPIHMYNTNIDVNKNTSKFNIKYLNNELIVNGKKVK